MPARFCLSMPYIHTTPPRQGPFSETCRRVPGSNPEWEPGQWTQAGNHQLQLLHPLCLRADGKKGSCLHPTEGDWKKAFSSESDSSTIEYWLLMQRRARNDPYLRFLQSPNSSPNRAGSQTSRARARAPAFPFCFKGPNPSQEGSGSLLPPPSFTWAKRVSDLPRDLRGWRLKGQRRGLFPFQLMPKTHSRLQIPGGMEGATSGATPGPPWQDLCPALLASPKEEA